MKFLYLLLFILSLILTILSFQLIYEKDIDVPQHIVVKDVTLNTVLLNKDSIFSNRNYLPIVKEKGIIPDTITALRVAVEIAHKLYGNNVLKQTPYKVCRNGDLWVVSSSVPEKYNNINWVYDASCFIIEINRYNGEIHDLRLK